MTRMHSLFAGAVMILSACQQNQSEETAAATKSSGDGAAAIAQVREGWIDAWKRADVAALTSFYADDAVDMNNHMPTVSGKAAILEGLRGMFSQVTPNDVTLTSEHVEIVDDLAYDRGTFSFTSTPKNGGNAVTEKGRYLVILRQQADGSWKLTNLMGNSADPLPQSQ